MNDMKSCFKNASALCPVAEHIIILGKGSVVVTPADKETGGFI